MKLRLLLVGLLAARAASALVPDKQLPAYTDYVVDQARILNPGAVKQIQATASRLDHAGVAQIAVCTVPDLGDWSKEEFAADLFRRAFLTRLGATAGAFAYEPMIEDVLDGLADHLERHLDLDALLAAARPPRLIRAA